MDIQAVSVVQHLVPLQRGQPVAGQLGEGVDQVRAVLHVDLLREEGPVAAVLRPVLIVAHHQLVLGQH